MLNWDELGALIERGDGRDRAFVDAVVRMEWSRVSETQRGRLRELHIAVKTTSLHRHAALRAQITSGALRGQALRCRFDDVPPFERDHFVEEVLGVAYPPLDEAALGPELTAYSPSGYDEIVHAFDATELGAGDRFVDLGSGMGKVVLLAALLTGATSTGIEGDGALVELAFSAAHELRLGDVVFQRGDARHAATEEAAVVFMYLPFTGAVLASVVRRLIDDGLRAAPQARRRFLCSGALDLARYPELVVAGPSRSWLHVYGWR
jgi:SAM-dependent methyltransferase